MNAIKNLFKNEIWIPILLGLLFFLIVAPGVDWGTPTIWHPDELISRVHQALVGQWQFDEKNFDYPSLPKYSMFWLGKLIYAFGYSKNEVIIAARLLSAVLGGLTVGITYGIVRTIGGQKITGILAALLLITNREFMLNAHWAHNDLYVTFFSSIAIFSIVKYIMAQNKHWLYIAFYSVGLAASSKYNGGILILLPILVYLYLERNNLKSKLLSIAETIFIGVILSFLGFATGTPKALLWAAFYFKRMIPVIQYQRSYGYHSDSVIGLVGQIRLFGDIFGIPVLILVLISLLSGALLLVKKINSKQEIKRRHMVIAVLFVSILLLDLPFIFSYNFQNRYFLPMVPILIVFVAIFIQNMISFFEERKIRNYKFFLSSVLILIIISSFLRISSIFLLFENDARISATEYVKTLPHNSSIEYTFYSPTINRDQFSRAHNYPLFFIKFQGQELPKSTNYDFNVGEDGIEDRKTDYLIIDSLTYERFSNEYICSSHQVDCDFFKRLQTGETNYQHIETFSYSLPPYLPEADIFFLNPIIQIYQRVKD